MLKNQIHGLDGVLEFGKRHCPDWDGTELFALFHEVEPDPPWEWKEISTAEKRVPIFENGEPVYISRPEAKIWWEEVKPEIVIEWQKENAAAERFSECVTLLLTKLVDAELEGYLLTNDGDLYKVLPKHWLSIGGDTMLMKGRAHVSFPRPPEKNFSAEGVVVFYCDFIDRPLTSKFDKNPSLAAIDLKNFPYVSFLLQATKNAPFYEDRKTPKRDIEKWLTQNWPDYLGTPSDTKISNLATFLRRPQDERGSVKK